MAAVVIGDSQIKYLHRYVDKFDIPTMSFSGFRIEKLVHQKEVNVAFSKFEVRQSITLNIS